MQQMADAHPIVGELRGVGLIGAVQLVSDKATRKVLPPTHEAPVKARDFALQNNLIMRPAGPQTLVVAPPLVITRPQVDELVDKMKRSLDQTAQLYGLA